MAKQYAFYIDSSACSGCKTCQVACKDKHDLDVGILWRRVYEISGGDWIQDGDTWAHNVFAYYVSISCNHCEEPICVSSCPTKALHKRKDGIVMIDQKKCIGCRYCEWACPYGALQYDSDSGTMTKCHLCYDQIDQGNSPACVTACPMRALDFGELRTLQEKYGRLNEVYPLPRANLTRPALVIRPHKDAVHARKEDASITNKEEI